MRSKTFIIKIAATIMMLAVAFGPVGALQQTQVVHAATCDASTPGAIYIPDTVSGGGYYSCSNGLVTNGNTGASQQGPADTSCSGITGCLAWVIYWIGPGFASWVASISASFFNYIVNISLNSTAYALTFLTTSWTLVLSVANMFFIFILIYAAFTIMLKAETSRTMQILAWVIAIALVVNFSFFFTRVIIDGGNIIATQFYNAIVAQVGGNAVQGAPPVDITTNIMTSLGAQTPLTSQGFTNVQATIGAGNAPWSTLLVLTVVFLSTAILFWMMAFGLIMIAIKFLIRVVGLWFVLIASPLAFVSKTLPKTQRFFDTWLQTLVGFAFYPAIFLFMFYILNLFAADLAGGSALFTALSSQANTAAAAGSTPAAAMSLIGTLADVFIRMGFLLVMFYIMLKAADWVMEQSGSLASMAMNRGSAALIGGGFRTAATVGAFAGRNVAGRGAFIASQNSAFQNWSQNSRIGSALWRGTVAASKSTFDVRNAPGSSVIKKGASAAGLNINTGTASKRNFDKIVSDKAKRDEELGKKLKATESEAWNEQQKIKDEYDAKNGDGSYNRRIVDLAKRRDEARKKQGEWDRAALKAPPGTSTNFEKEQAEIHKLEAGRLQKELKPLVEAGKNKSKENERERINQFADRLDKRGIEAMLNPSWGHIEGAGKVRNLIKEKTGKDKAAEALKEMRDEGEIDGDEPTPTGGGSTAGGGSGGGTGGGHGPAAGGGTGGGAPAAEMHEQTQLLRKIERDVRKTNEQNRESFSHLGQVLHTPTETDMGAVKKLEKRIDQKLNVIADNTTSAPAPRITPPPHANDNPAPDQKAA